MPVQDQNIKEVTLKSETDANAQKLLEIEKKLLSGVKMGDVIGDIDLVAKARDNFKIARDARRRYDWEWLSRDLYRRGYQFTKYNPSTRTITMTAASQTRIPINLTAAAMRVIRNQVVAFRPKWEVMPNNIDDESRDNAKYSGKLLDYVYTRFRLKKKVKETVTQGLLFSVGGPWQIGWDNDIEMEDGSKGFVYIWGLDPFDFYVDPNATDGMVFTDAEFLVKAVRRSLNYVKSNPNYHNTEMLTKGDYRLASSEYKQFLLQAIKYTGQWQSTEESETVILYEGYFKEHNPKTGKVKIRQLTWVDSVQLPLQNILHDTDDYPFRMYQADLNPLEVYGEGWARNVIPINRVINALESSIFDYNYKYAKGRLVMDKNAGIRIVTNENGSIIEKNRGADIHALPLQPLMPSAESQSDRMRSYFEDISGAHDVSLGRIPVGVKSGIGIAELKQSDATNQDDLVDALEDFLVEVGKKVLMVISEKVTFPRLVKSTNIIGKAEYFTIVGSDYASARRNKKTTKIKDKEYPLAIITPNNTIQVQIGSWLAYSKQQRQQELKDLFTQGVIDQRTLLEHLEFGDVDTVIERTRQEAILKKRRDAAQITPNNVSEEEVAQSENDMLLMGDTRVVAMPQDDHDVHIYVHNQHQSNKLVAEHIHEHQVLKQAQKNQPAQVAGAEQPQAGSQGEAAQLNQQIQQVPPEILAAGAATAPQAQNAPKAGPQQPQLISQLPPPPQVSFRGSAGGVQ